ncbi:hypothetical protein RBWH47_00428 [Rhodopirellula baltica WH47]|uniref:Uncharacterized protein n=1 Tax=Rhodopirellula baltica WH47 TaxID=991778 RepID=F2AXJ9_RHOBT|nr:hypothetical protein RBWH47_00428 [Rhodopirellula baltica WH47]
MSDDSFHLFPRLGSLGSSPNTRHESDKSTIDLFAFHTAWNKNWL